MEKGRVDEGGKLKWGNDYTLKVREKAPPMRTTYDISHSSTDFSSTTQTNNSVFLIVEWLTVLVLPQQLL